MVIDKNLSTWIKLGAAIIVALHHYSQYVCANGLSSNIFYTIMSSQGGYLAVAVFFFLSGYGSFLSFFRQFCFNPFTALIFYFKF